MVRELVKWDYELRMPGQVGDVVARARRSRDGASARAGLSGAAARAAVGAAAGADRADQAARRKRRPRIPIRGRSRQLAEWIAAAERPLIITAALPAERGARRSAQLAERCAIPVVAHNPRTVCLPSSHPMHFGFEPGALLADADLVIVHRIRRAVDPASAASARRLPRRAYRRGPVLRALSDALASRAISRSQAGTVNALDALDRGAGEPRLQMAEARIAARRARLTERMRTRRAQLAKDSAAGRHDLAGISVARASAKPSATTPSSSTNIRCAPRPLPARKARHVVRARSGRRARLGLRRRARRQARRAGQVRRRDARRRRLHVRQSDGRPLGRRQFTICRSSPSSSTTAATAPCGARRCRCSRTAPPARTTAARSPISIRRRHSRRWRARKAPMPSAWKNPPTCPTRWRAPATRCRQRTQAGAAQRHYALLNR